MWLLVKCFDFLLSLPDLPLRLLRLPLLGPPLLLQPTLFRKILLELTLLFIEFVSDLISSRR